ncbi:hypothetical protein OTU49_006209, partial [Cherax quadricarinatus]
GVYRGGGFGSGGYGGSGGFGGGGFGGGGFGGGGFGGGGFGGGGFGGGGFGGGGFGGRGFGGGGVRGEGSGVRAEVCEPQVILKTHYKTKLNEVPVLKTVLSKKLVLQPYTEYLYSTIYKENTLYLTKTEFVTNTDYVTRVTHKRFTETLSKVLYYPEYATSTYSVTQYQPVHLTNNVYTTEISPYAVTSTQVETVYDTITKETVITHKSEVPVASTYVLTKTSTKYHNIVVTATKLPYDDPKPNIVLFTSKIIKQQPSYFTSTFVHTHYVTTTNILKVPYYVTQTVAKYCGPYDYGYSKKQVSLPGSGNA